MLYIISTPIGNLGDISRRAMEVLEKVEILLCEDTRQTNRLLMGLQIKNRPELVSFYDEIEEEKMPVVIEWLREGKEVGLVSDGGTPVISDPGFKLVARCQKLGLALTAIPGPCAAVNGLVLSGLPSGRFVFLGFLPKKNGERKKILEEYKQIKATKVVYESPFRVDRLMSEIKQVCGENVEIRVIREMTKKFEEVLAEPKKIKGEVVVVFI